MKDRSVLNRKLLTLRLIPSVWLIHLPVGDLFESLRRVSEDDGQVVHEFAEEKSAIVRDPVGVYLALQHASV